jgi:nucleoside 2-deoxyribosyltransferase
VQFRNLGSCSANESLDGSRRRGFFVGVNRFGYLAVSRRERILPAMEPKPCVYLAGPDVFHPDAKPRLLELARLCDAHGMEALIPSDELVPTFSKTVPETIFELNLALLKRADGVIANLGPFRGSEPDSGTVFEVGFAYARGRHVVGYGVPGGTEYWQHVDAVSPVKRGMDGKLRDAQGLVVEDFSLPLNLMLANVMQVEPTALDAIKVMAALLRVA